MIRALIFLMLAPLALMVGLYGCTAATVVSLRHTFGVASGPGMASPAVRPVGAHPQYGPGNPPPAEFAPVPGSACWRNGFGRWACPPGTPAPALRG